MTNAIQLVTPPAEGVSAQVARIRNSKSLAGSVLTQNLLTHLVRHALAGDRTQLKEKIIGIEVFSRKADYDPQVDTIVRQETERLRYRLLAYYKTEGVRDNVRIGLARGEFTPYFGLMEEKVISDSLSSLNKENPSSSASAGRFSNTGNLSKTGNLSIGSLSTGKLWMRPLMSLAGVSLLGAVSWGVLPRLLSNSTLVSPASLSSAAPSLAVLPLRNGSSGKVLDYSVDGFTETIRASLAATGKLRVSSQEASFAFKNKEVNPRMMARALFVDRLLQGDYRHNKDKIEIELRLLNAHTSEQIWALKGEASNAELPSLRQRFLAGILQALKLPIDAKGMARLEGFETKSPAAYEHYLTGLQDLQVKDSGLSSGGIFSLPRSASHFRSALREDPSYLPAHLGLADSLSRLSLISSNDPQEILSEALREWEKAVELDPGHAEAQAMLGVHLARHEQDYQRGERQIQQALQLNPLSSVAHAQLVQHILLPQMRWKEAESKIARALALDPNDATALESNAKLLALQGKTKEAVQEYEKLPSGPRVLLAVARAYLEGGNQKEAQAIVQRLMQIVPNPEVQAMNCYLYGLAGRKPEARQMAELLQMVRQLAYVPPSAIAWVRLGLGENTAALQALEEARLAKDPELSMLRVSKIYDPLRGEARFQKLVSPLGLTNTSAQILSR